MRCPVCFVGPTKRLETKYVGEDGNDGIDELHKCRLCFAKFELWYSRGADETISYRGLNRHIHRLLIFAPLGSLLYYLYSSM